MNTEKMIAVLVGKSGTAFDQIIAEYIVWQLGRMSNRELAEATAAEIEKGMFKMKDIRKKIIDAAAANKGSDSCAVLSDDTVFSIVREALYIDKAIPEEEKTGFVPSSMKIGSAVKVETPAVSESSSAAVTLDFDDIWG